MRKKFVLIKVHRDTEPIGYIERVYKALAQEIVEAQKSHDLPSANGRPRKSGGVALVQT